MLKIKNLPLKIKFNKIITVGHQVKKKLVRELITNETKVKVKAEVEVDKSIIIPNILNIIKNINIQIIIIIMTII